jgi:hypothetical protein
MRSGGEKEGGNATTKTRRTRRKAAGRGAGERGERGIETGRLEVWDDDPVVEGAEFQEFEGCKDGGVGAVCGNVWAERGGEVEYVISN